MALSKEQQDFFASERTKRQNTQDKVIDDAEEILDSDSSSDTELTEAQENVERIISFFTTQDTIENSVEYVYLEDSTTKTKEIQPVIRGVLVVCEGGDDPVVTQTVTQAVTRALDISSAKVCVTKLTERR